MEAYQIKLDCFEGPMDLLVHLIEKEKLDIYDIPISQLTSQYLEYLDMMREFNMEIASSFLVMAATLLQIKSRMMLPRQEPLEETDEDPREELIRQIIEYKKFKEVTSIFSSMADEASRFVARRPMDLPVHHIPPSNLSAHKLAKLFFTLLSSMTDTPTIPSVLVVPEEFNVKEKIADLLGLFNKVNDCVTLRQAIFSGKRNELIVTFLALLELLKTHQIIIKQENIFSDIIIKRRKEISNGSN